jgi:hypothetical protein
MTKKNLVLILFAISLATVYVVWFSDWFKPKKVDISYTNRNLHRNAGHGNALRNLIFGVRPQTRLTELKVVPLAVFETNKNAVAVWHLVSDSNSIPVKTFFYGEHIAGMRPAISGDSADALETNVTYRMFITAGRVKGQHDFELKELD